MMPWSWIQTQVETLTVAELKTVLKRKRLKLSRERLFEYLEGLVASMVQHQHVRLIDASKSREMT